MTTGYENVRRLTHENLLPALQRCSVVVSRLRGLSKFEDSRVALGLETSELDQIFDTISCLQLLCHTILIYASSELRQFTAFSAWLRQEVETQATDPLSTTAEENMDKDVVPDYPLIFEYVQGALKRSRLHDLFNMPESGAARPKWSMAGDEEILYDRYKIELRKFKKDVTLEQELPGLAFLVSRLDRQCRVVFQRTARAQGQKVRFSSPVRVGRKSKHCEIRMVPQVRRPCWHL